MKMNNRVFSRTVAGIVLAFSSLLASCGDSELKFHGTDITAAKIGRGWELSDHDGNKVTDQSFKGKVGLVFFGFTQCPDVCPASLSKVSNALSMLGDKAKDVQVLMISVDPERDTPQVLKAYLEAFDEGLPTRFLGLSGTPDQTKRAAEAFKAYFAKSPQADGGYTMDHSASFYLMDKQGNVRVLASSQTDTKSLAEDLKTLIDG